MGQVSILTPCLTVARQARLARPSLPHTHACAKGLSARLGLGQRLVRWARLRRRLGRARICAGVGLQVGKFLFQRFQFQNHDRGDGMFGQARPQIV